MTVGDGSGTETHHLPEPVTQVKKETIKNFPHSKRVGGYLLGQTLGVGSFAKVKEGLHLITGEKVAIKIIDKKRAKTDNYVRKNLRREGKLLQMIRHPNVVALLEVMETDNSYYLVTEICRGGDLMQYISARKRLPEEEVSKLIRQIVSAVDYLHRMGIIHRDLKIENLLLDENKNIKLIDFGLSNFIKVADSPEGTQAEEFCVTQCGSPAYAAPELLNHEKYGLPVDLWSIGVNMYAMLTGGLPFTVEPFSIKALYAKMKDGQMNPVPEGLSRDCRDLLHKFLTADPSRRVTITEALNHPWLMQGNKSVVRHPCPNRMRTSDLDADILSHMSDNLNFRMAEVIKFVTCNIPSSARASYHLYQEKLRRYNAELRLESHMTSTAASRPTNENSRITLHLQDMSANASKEQPLSSSAPRNNSSFPRLQGIMPTDNSGSDTNKSTKNIKRDSSAATARSNTDGILNETENRNQLTRYDLSKTGSTNSSEPPPATFVLLPSDYRRPTRGHPLQQASKETHPKGKPAPEVTTPRITEQMDIGRSFLEHLSQKAVLSEKEDENLRLNFASPASQSKNQGSPLGITMFSTRPAKKEMLSEQNHSKASQDVAFEPGFNYTVTNSEQHYYDNIIRDTNNHSESTQPSHTRRYIPNNRLLSWRNVIKTVDMNASSISDERSQMPSLKGGSQNFRTSGHPSPAVSKILPWQCIPFRSAQDRMRLSENYPPHFIKQPQKSKTSESMILHGKNLLNTARSVVLEVTPKLGVSPPSKPAVVRRKLIKRQRINELTPPESHVIQDIDQVTTTDLLISDVMDLKSARGDDVSVTSPFPSISR